MIDALATEPHYLSHIAPVWQALDPAERGTFWVAGGLADQAGGEGVANMRVGWPAADGDPVLVASWTDSSTVRRRGRRVMYLEHGAGQTYRTDQPNPCYSGGPDHDGTVLFLSPSELVADRWRHAYPVVPAVAVGCPRLDVFHRAAAWRPLSPAGDSPTVAISFHSQGRLCPETYGAFEHYERGLAAASAAVRAAGGRMLGHGHPRLWSRVGGRWERYGIEPVRDFAEILSRADLYCCDNSSTLPEAASCGIPLLWLNAPWFRREVHHGGRFWEWPQGQATCDEPADLPDAVLRALAGPPGAAEASAAMVAGIYVACDGRAAERAVAAIRAL